MRSYPEYLQDRVDRLQRLALIQSLVLCLLTPSFACLYLFASYR